MKIFIPIFILIFFTSCASKNAFSEFSLSENQELSITSLKRSKVMQNGQVEGAFNAIYLNEVYPDIYNEDEYFFVYFYLKTEQEISDPNTNDDKKLKIYLNNIPPIKLKQLPSENRFSKLSGSKNKWSKYYLVSFAKTGKDLTLKLESDRSFSAVLTYQKDQQ